jgi:hypothetical protein
MGCDDVTDTDRSHADKPEYLCGEFSGANGEQGVRLEREYSLIEQSLQDWHIRSTIVVFGSARVHGNGPGRHAFRYEQARAFGRIASEQGGATR